MRSVSLSLVLLVACSGTLDASITKCSLMVSRLKVHVIASPDENYAVRIPQSAARMVQVSDENEHLYISESRPSNGESIEVMLPRGIALDCDVSQSGQVLIDQHNGSLTARVANTGVFHLAKGSLSELTLDMSGPSTCFAPDCVAGRATLRLSDDADAVIERVSSFAEKTITRGARLYCNNECVYGGERGARNEFSLARVYRAVGEPLTPAMEFYDACATAPTVMTKRHTTSYDGNPLYSDDKQIHAVLDLLAQEIATPAQSNAVADAISALPPEREMERQVLGAMLCRRLLLCTLKQPVGPGAVSPQSLWAMKHVPQEFRDAFDGMMQQMYESSQLLVSHPLLKELGDFGTFYYSSAKSLKRLRSRVLNAPRVVNRYRWVPFLDHIYQNLTAFIKEGRPSWGRVKA